MRLLLPRRLCTLLLIPLSLSLFVAFITWHHRVHPSFFNYLWHAKYIEAATPNQKITTGSSLVDDASKNSDSESRITIFDKPPGIPMANGIYAHWSWILIAKPWIWFKNIFHIDLGPAY